MTLQEKAQMLEQNKEAAIAALDSVLDTYLNLTNPVFDENGNLKEHLFKDEKAKNEALNLRADIPKYDNLRLKIKNGDFSLSPSEFAYVGISFLFCRDRAMHQIEAMQKAKELCDTLGVLFNTSENELSKEDLKTANNAFKKALDSLTSTKEES